MTDDAVLEDRLRRHWGVGRPTVTVASGSLPAAEALARLALACGTAEGVLRGLAVTLGRDSGQWAADAVVRAADAVHRRAEAAIDALLPATG